MEVRASVKYIRVAPRKLRTVVDLIRGKDVAQAQGILLTNNKLNISRQLAKLLDTATANATNNLSLDVDSLYVKYITVDQGPSLKRFLPRMRGRADRILKRMSEVTVVLDEREGKKKAPKQQASGKGGAKKEAKPKGEKKAKAAKATEKDTR
jgi:large subunit ribosomal protein L22